MHVVLVGASIGKSWNLPALPERLHTARYSFEALQAWQYDKSDTVDEVLMRPARKFQLTRTYFKGWFLPSPRKPDLVVLKECSSYFPGDVARDKALYQRWVEEIQAKNIPVMVATVVPITRDRALRDGPNKQPSIREFNDWVRTYAEQKRLPLLDLEKAMRADAAERYLRDDLTSGDGSHLNRKAYDILDQVMVQALCRYDGTCGERQISAK